MSSVTYNNPYETGQNGPLQLIEFTSNAEGRKLQLRQDTIDIVSRNVGDLPICIISICGPSRQGKSFLLGYIIRRLIGLEENVEDWMGRTDPTRPLQGFKFQNGKTPETKGIWVWSRPFIVKNDHGKEVAVLLMDTQGTYDESTIKDMASVVGLSILMSSVLVFNHFTNLQEDVLSALNTYIEYGTLALNEDKQSGAPFQKLNFLIRDWNNPWEYAYGIEGGRKFLKEKLEVKESHPLEVKRYRQVISNCFDELDCFLMPHIGDEALRLDFHGSLSELSPRFANYMEKFITSLVNAKSLIVKTLMGSPVASTQLKSMLETYINVFNSDEAPSAESMWQATSEIHNSNIHYKGITNYNKRVMKVLEDTCYLSNENLTVIHSEAESETMAFFNQARKIGSLESILEFKKKLKQSIAASLSDFQLKNEAKRKKCINAAVSEAKNEFRSKLEIKFPFASMTEFYNETNLKNFAANKQSTLLSTFKLKLSNENSHGLVAYVNSIQESFNSTLSSHLNQNRINCSNVETKIVENVNRLCINHRSEFRIYLKRKWLEQDESKLESAHNLLNTKTVDKFRPLNKLGDEEFQTKYLAMLTDKLQECYNQLMNEHRRGIQNVKIRAAQSVDNCIANYKKGMQDAMQKWGTRTKILNCHKKFQSRVTNQLIRSIPGNDALILQEFQLALNEKIDQSFSDFQKLFNAYKAEASAKAKSALICGYVAVAGTVAVGVATAGVVPAAVVAGAGTAAILGSMFVASN